MSKTRIYTLISAVCYIIYAICIWLYIPHYNPSFIGLLMFGIYICIYIGMAVLLYLKKNNMLWFIFQIVQTCITYLIWELFWHEYPSVIVWIILSEVFLCIVFLCNTTPIKNEVKVNAITKWISLLPAIFLLIGYALYWYKRNRVLAYNSFNDNLKNYLPFFLPLYRLIGQICKIIATLFSSIWVTNTRTSNAKKVVQEKVYSADDLKAYKELLDLGAITEDEFEKKKKQCLK